MSTAAFYDAIRPMFGGSFSQTQVDGIADLLAAASAGGMTDQRQVAYLLATAKHETAGTMQPIAEYGKGKGRPYGRPDPKTGKTYYGRGFVQLTWIYNYDRAGKELGVDLVNSPDKAMVPEIAARIAVTGMLEGWFTGKKLSDYFNDKKADPINARKIINGLDRATMIAGYFQKFHAALKVAA